MESSAVEVVNTRRQPTIKLTREQTLLTRHLQTLQRGRGTKEECSVEGATCAFIFDFLENTEDARKFISDHLPPSAKIDDERSPNKEESGSMCTYDRQLHVSVTLHDDQRPDDLITSIADAWVSQQVDGNDHIGTFEANIHPDILYTDTEFPPMTTFKNVGISGGGMPRPTSFNKHWVIDEVKAYFEHDKSVLTISSDNMHQTDSMSIEYESIGDKIVIEPYETKWKIYVHIKNAPTLSRLYANTDAHTHQPQKIERLTEFRHLKREAIGKTSVICLEMNTSLRHNTSRLLLSRLRQKGFSIVFTKVTSQYVDDVGLGTVQFDDHNLNYAWMSLLSCGYHVSDAISRHTIESLMENKDQLQPDMFYLLRAIARINQFFDFDAELEECLECINLPSNNLPAKHVMLGEVVITPTREIVLPKRITPCNALTHQVEAGELLQVIFRDEDTAFFSVPERTILNQIEARIKEFMDNVFILGGSRFDFLVATESEDCHIRLWYYHSFGDTTVDILRRKLGLKDGVTLLKEGDIGVRAQEPMVIGDSAGVECDIQYETGRELEFSDQNVMGRISPAMATKIGKELRLRQTPAILDLMYNGYRGKVLVDPGMTDAQDSNITGLHRKLKLNSDDLYVLECSKPEPVQLSPGMMTVLSDMGTPDKSFLQIQRDLILSATEKLLQSDSESLDEITPFEQTESDKLKTKKWLFPRSDLEASFKQKVEIMKDNVSLELSSDQGRTMHGIVVSSVLQRGQVFVAYTTGTEPGDYTVVKGNILVLNQTCLTSKHVGVFEAVDVPGYHHLKDCIVYPLDNMSMAPSHLGKFAVIWDKELFPPGQTRNDMSQLTTELQLDRDTTTDGLAYLMRNYHCGQIRKMYLTYADINGVGCRECQSLASLYADVLDMADNSNLVGSEHKGYLSTDRFPCFIAGKNEACYTSHRVLGQMHRVVVNVADAIKSSGQSTQNTTASMPNLWRYPGYERYMEGAVMCKDKYDTAIMHLMLTNKISDETYLITESRENSGKCCYDVSMKYLSLLHDTREEFFEEFGGQDKVDVEDIDHNGNVLAKASAWYIVTDQYANAMPFPLRSFPYTISEKIAKLYNVLNKSGKVSRPNITDLVGEAIVHHHTLTQSQRNCLYEEARSIAQDVTEAVRENLPGDGTVSLIGLPLSRLMDKHKHEVELYIHCTKKLDSQQLRSLLSKCFPDHHEKDDQCIVLKKNGECVHLTISQNKIAKEQADYVCDHIKDHPSDFNSLQFLLDWARKINLIGNSRIHLLHDVTFVLAVIGILQQGREVQPGANACARPDIDNKCQEIGCSVLNVLRKLIDLLQPGEHGEIKIGELKNPIKSLSHRRLIPRNLEDSDCQLFLQQTLTTLCRLAISEGVMSLLTENCTHPQEVSLMLSGKLWESIFMSKTYTANMLEQTTGVSVSIRDVTFHGIPGYVLETRGSRLQVALLSIRIETLTRKASSIRSASIRNQVQQGAFKVMFEGRESENDKISILPYDGRCHPQHMSDSLGQPVLTDEHGSDSDDIDVFEEEFVNQIDAIKKRYDADEHGPLRLCLTFGTYYLIHATPGEKNITISGLLESLSRCGYGRGPDRDQIRDRENSYGYRGSGARRFGQGYSGSSHGGSRGYLGSSPGRSPDYSGSSPRGSRDYSGSSPHESRDYSGSSPRGSPDFSGSSPRGNPDYSGSSPRGSLDYSGSSPRGSPDYSGSSPRGSPNYSGSSPRGSPDYSGSSPRGNPDYSGSSPRGSPDYSGSSPRGSPDYSGSSSRGSPDYSGSSPGGSRGYGFDRRSGSRSGRRGGDGRRRFHVGHGNRGHLRKMRSSFIPLECSKDKVSAFLSHNRFIVDTIVERYNVDFALGQMENMGVHRATVTLDNDLKVIEFRLVDLKWFVADVINARKSDGRLHLDVRCKVTSRRYVPPNIIHTLCTTNQRFLEKQHDATIAVHRECLGKIDYVRRKKVTSYKYDGPRAEKSMWHGVEIRVSTVSEYSQIDQQTGIFGSVVTQEEVSIIPPLPDTQGEDMHWGEFARSTWELITLFSEQFDL